MIGSPITDLLLGVGYVVARADIVAKRYAEAVFDLARERGDFEAWAQELDAIATLMSDPEAAAILSSVRVRPEAKAVFLERSLPGLRPEALSLARLLVANRRVAQAAAIRDLYRALWDEHRGIIHAQAVTAVPLDEEEKGRLTRRLADMTGKQVVLETKTDPSILGGLIVRIGDRVIDGSTRTKLLALRKRMEGAVV